MDTTRVSKTINAPMHFVYDWCTDFRDDDPAITGSKSRRIVLARTKKKVVYAQLYEGADGSQKVAVDIVTLNPPDSWHLDYFGEEDDETGEYHLKDLGNGKTRLDMVFKEKWKILKTPTLEEQTNQTSRVWDKYVEALEEDYKSGSR